MSAKRLIANPAIFITWYCVQLFISVISQLILKWSNNSCVFSLASWQHINFIGKYEFYNRVDILNIQYVIKKFTDVFKIDISSVSRM